MHSPTALILGVIASFASGQITLTPTTIRGGSCPLTVTATLVQTSRVTVVSTATRTVSQVLTSTRTVQQIVTQVVTQVVTRTATVTTTRPCAGAACPTLVATATACRTCLIPGCTSTVAVTRPCGCSGALPTSTVDLGCDVADVCNKIGCRTVYDVRTATC